MPVVELRRSWAGYFSPLLSSPPSVFYVAFDGMTALSDVIAIPHLQAKLREQRGSMRALAGTSKACRAAAWLARDPLKRLHLNLRPGPGRLSPELAAAVTSLGVWHKAALQTTCPNCTELTGDAEHLSAELRDRLPCLKKVTIRVRPLVVVSTVRALKAMFEGVEDVAVVRKCLKALPFRPGSSIVCARSVLEKID